MPARIAFKIEFKERRVRLYGREEVRLSIYGTEKKRHERGATLSLSPKWQVNGAREYYYSRLCMSTKCVTLFNKMVRRDFSGVLMDNWVVRTWFTRSYIGWRVNGICAICLAFVFSNTILNGPSSQFLVTLRVYATANLWYYRDNI